MGSALQEASSAALKQRRLNAQVVEIRRRLRSSFQRHLSSNPSQIGEWRRQVGNIALSRLALTAERGRLGHLLRSFEISELEVASVLHRCAASGGKPETRWHALHREQEHTSSRSYESEITDAEYVARAVATHWATRVRCVARSSRLARSVFLPQSVLLHIAEELIIGARRADLVGCMTERIVRFGQQIGDANVTASISAVLVRLVCVYVETLVAPCDATRTNQFAYADPATFSSYPSARDPADNTVVPLGRRWPNSFQRLVERNIEEGPHMASRPEMDRELAELLSALSTQTYEVES